MRKFHISSGYSGFGSVNCVRDGRSSGRLGLSCDELGSVPIAP